MDTTSPERLPEDAVSVPNSYLAAVPAKTDSAGHFDAGMANGVVPISIKYAAIRDLRAAIAGPQDEALGVLVGTYSQGARIEHCMKLPLQPGPRASQAQVEEAVIRYIEHVTELCAAENLEAIGLFRTQAGAWSAMKESDCELVRRCLCTIAPRRAVFVLIRAFDHRPWSAGVFLPDHNQPASWTAPALEFPFDEYLLRNGYFNELGVSNELPPPRAPAKVWWRRKPAVIAGAAAAVLLLGAAVVSWIGAGSASPFRTGGAAAAISRSTTLDLRIARNGDFLGITWNRNARILEQALDGVLTISDGSLDRAVKLNASQLREGYILYQSPSTGDIDFRLVVTDGARSEAQSVKLLEWKTQPAVGDYVSPFQSAAAGAAPPAGKKPNNPVALPAFQNAPGPPLSLSGIPAPRLNLDRTAPGLMERQPAASTATAGLAPPAPIRRVEPDLSPEVTRSLKSAVGRVGVDIRMSVGEDGSVKQAQVAATTGNPPSLAQLAEASIAAAKQWKFRPGTLNGKPTATEFIARFAFHEDIKPNLPLKPFNAEALLPSLRPGASPDLLDAPSVNRTVPPVNLSLKPFAPEIELPPPAPSRETAAPTVAPTVASTAAAPARPQERLDAAVLISRKDPVYPRAAQQHGVTGVVKLSAMVGADGRVRGVKVVSGHLMLRTGAVEAVSQWVYSPALLNGKPIESPVEIELSFHRK